MLASIGTAYHPACEAEVARAEEGAAVDLADAVVKVYGGGRMRTRKWTEAQKDWEAIVGCEWAVKARSEALNGVARCKKMVLPERVPSICFPGFLRTFTTTHSTIYDQPQNPTNLHHS